PAQPGIGLRSADPTAPNGSFRKSEGPIRAFPSVPGAAGQKAPSCKPDGGDKCPAEGERKARRRDRPPGLRREAVGDARERQRRRRKHTGEAAESERIG